MAAPNLAANPAPATYSNTFAILLDTASEENLIGNSSGSNKTMNVDVWLYNSDGTNLGAVTIRDRAAVGTPIINNTNAASGADPTVTTGTDSVTGTATKIVDSFEVPARSGIPVLTGYRIRENHSLTFQAGNANRITVVLTPSQIG